MVNKITVILLVLLSNACASAPHVSVMDAQRKEVIDCIKDLRNTTGVETMDAFEICRQLYRIKKISEVAPERPPTSYAAK